jgi:DNA replicative helicase MCM subunit Mcm2 (Cdc46/Mcm family)
MRNDDLAPVEKLSEANDHRDRADDLIDEAVDEAIKIVRRKLSFGCEITAEYKNELGTINVSVYPEDARELVDTEGAATTQPMIVSFSNMSFSRKDRIENIRSIISQLEDNNDNGAPKEAVLQQAELLGMSRPKADKVIENLRSKGDVYEPKTGHLRAV